MAFAYVVCFLALLQVCTSQSDEANLTVTPDDSNVETTTTDVMTDMNDTTIATETESPMPHSTSDSGVTGSHLSTTVKEDTSSTTESPVTTENPNDAGLIHPNVLVFMVPFCIAFSTKLLGQV
uniref:U52-Sparatoxin-Hju1a_1 n=1 Tax=Heteropoda jugulans TaxID=1358901 RepID=A0A4Q8K9D4_9ARAC